MNVTYIFFLYRHTACRFAMGGVKRSVGFPAVVAVLILAGCLLNTCECSVCESGTVMVKYSLPDGSEALPIAECTSDSNTSMECCSCPNSTLKCVSLDAALDEVQVLNVSTAEFILGDEGNASNIVLNNTHNISQEMYVFSLSGVGNTTIDCTGSEDGAWISLMEVSNVSVSDLTWEQCGGRSSRSHPPAVVSTTDCDRITLVNVDFDNSPSIAVSCTNAVLITIEDCNFRSGQAVALNISNLHSSKSSLLEISNSFFVSNGNENQRGGGISITSVTDTGSINIIMDETVFKDNRAEYGGALYITDVGQYAQNCPNINVTMSNTDFVGNCAQSTGGAIFYLLSSNAFYQCLPTVINCTNCTFLRNVAEKSLAIHTEFITNLNDLICDLYLTNCTFESNSPPPMVPYRFDRFGCSNYITKTAIIARDVTFAKNQATALCLSAGTLIVYGSITFDSNRAFVGGAMNVIGTQSSLVLVNGSVWNFTNNTAIYGGAIYQTLSLNDQGPCLFKSSESRKGNTTSTAISSEIATVDFVNNNATIAGLSIYYNQPTNDCRLALNNSDYRITFYPDNQAQLGSVATSITFHSPIKLLSNMKYQMTVTLGQFLVFNASVTDFFMNNSSAPVNVIPEANSSFITSQAIEYTMHGSQVISLNNGRTITNLYFTGEEVTSNQTTSTVYSLQLVGLVVDASSNTTITIDLKFEPCPLGWYYDPTQSMCVCYESPSILCSERTSENTTACIKIGYWIGFIMSGTDSNTTTVTYCPAGFCNSTRAGGNTTCPNCPFSEENEYCLLPINNYNKQCRENRADVTCAECLEDFSFTFGAVRCEPSSTCSSGNSALLVLASILFLVSLVIIIIVLLKADYRLNSGYTFSFVYYFSIVRLLLPFDFPSEGIRVIVSIFESYTQLNPRILGYIPYCFLKSAHALDLIGMQYLFPLLASICIFGILVLIHYCPCRVRWLQFTDGTFVRGITILIFLSFTSLTETSFALLNPVGFDKVNKIYIGVEPTMEYFTGVHIFWALLAIFIELFLITPFILLLLLAPFLMRVRKIHLIRIKPFLDEFQSCYKDEYRWMAFYYFACRQLYLLVYMNPNTDFTPTQYYMQLISIMVAVFHTTLQPYSDSWLNVVDTVLLTDLALVSVLYGQTALTVFANYSWLQNTIAYILIFIPIVYILVLPLILKLKVFLPSHHKGSYNTRIRTTPNLTPSTRTRTLVDSNLFRDREPLIGLLNDDDPKTSTYVHVPPQRDSGNSAGSASTESAESDYVVHVESPDRTRATSFFLADGSIGFRVRTITEDMPQWKPVAVSSTRRKDAKSYS